MKKTLFFVSMAIALVFSACSPKYETVKGDPLKTKIYTLDNGLKVYMTVNKNEPRLQAYIAVNSGGANDPSDNTGLAHYLEHLMFKGSENLGTSDFAAEKVILDQIEDLYEVYRTKEDPAERKAIYHVIDSLSYEASKISIPNEYDKSMAVIGGMGTNAFTSNDVTCYTEDIPSNQIENWAKIQSDRFKNFVIRGFHTELETVYEEYNMYLNYDSENAMMALDSVLFPHHPYGLQSVIGTSEHLKNPSIKTIKKQKATFYVPNNTAICVSGDFDPDEFVAIIEKYFGDWEPNPELPVRVIAEEAPIEQPVVKNVYGTESDFVMIGWRYPGDKNQFDSEISEIVSAVLNNGRAGIMDLDIIQKQKTLSAAASTYTRTDWGEFLLDGYPKQGQTLEEVSDILLESIGKVRSGDFSEDLITAAIANFKLRQMRTYEQNRGRVMSFVNSFIAGHNWADDVNQIDRLSKVTKQDVVDWANKYLGENSYCVVYKRNGANPKNQKIEAPAITPIATNRDKQSEFLSELQASEVKPIEPVFVDFDKDMSVFTTQGLEVLYKHNDQNDVATLQFMFDEGKLTDPTLDITGDYISYLGSETRSAEEIALEMYKLACNYRIQTGASRSSVSVNGLSENIGKSLDIVEDLLANAVADEEILAGLKQDLLQSRIINKMNQRSCNSALQTYIMYGPEYVRNTTMTNDEIISLDSEKLLANASNLLSKQHRILYYGPMTESELKAMLAEHHNVAAELEPLELKFAQKKSVNEPKVFIAPYDSRQFNYIQYSNRGEKLDLEENPSLDVFNEYFGGGMNAIVFQEMREARGLAYSASANLSTPTFADDSYSFYARIGSQNDKLQIAVEAFDEIINNMPESQKAFDIAVSALDGQLRTTRTNGMSVLNSYISCKDLGIAEPTGKALFETLQKVDLKTLKETQQKWIKGRVYEYGILGDARGLDMDYLKTLGPVKQVSLEEIFGY
ncbi:MAG: insulinase family protein [Bacteroidales bacterium]|nr:insulinase family protein [Bacteroidales bacterium]